MNRTSVLEILRSTHELLKVDASFLPGHGVHTVGRMFHGASSYEVQTVELAAARLGVPLVDLSWTGVESKSSQILLEEVRMASESVDLLVTCFAESETFGDGHRLSKEFPEASSVPLVSVVDDTFGWQSALAHLAGFEEQHGNLSEMQLVVSWGFGKSFVHPTTAHSLVLAGLLSGANVRVVSPPEFSIMNRVRREASKLASENGISFEERHEFNSAFGDADAVFAANWLRLDEYNHPERHSVSARPYSDWHFTPDVLPKDCVFSTEPPLETPLLVSNELVKDPRNITSTWLARRVRVLMASMLRAVQ